MIVAARFVAGHGGEHRRLRFDEVVVHGNDLFAAAALERLRAVVFVGEEVLQGTEEESPQAAFFAVGAGEGILFEQVNEEGLRQVLRVRGGVAAASQERVQRRPVGLAKIRQRGLRGDGRLALHGEQDHAPMRRLEGGSALLQCAWNSFHRIRITKRRRRDNERESAGR